MTLDATVHPSAARILAQLSSPDLTVTPLALAHGLIDQALQTPDWGNSVSNCHVQGLDSLVLFDGRLQGDGMIRVYYARHGEHKLDRLMTEEGHFTVGIHNHRYQIAKIPLNASMYNVRTWVTDHPTGHQLYEYAFTSSLAGKSDCPTVQLQGLRHMAPVRLDDMPVGSVVVMADEDLHTVQVPVHPESPGTAWMVIEGPATEIQSLIYSPRPDLSIQSEGLYRPMSAAQAEQALREILSLIPV